MKKALALVLALVLALSLGVSAFALDFVDLDEDKTPSTDTRIDVSEYPIHFDEKDTKVFRATAKGGTFYMLIDATDMVLKDVEVVSSGNVSAKVVPYDPETMKGAGVNYALGRSDGKDVEWNAAQQAAYNEVVAAMGEHPYAYAFTKAVADAFNRLDKVRDRYIVVPDKNYYVVELVVAPNYSAAYTEGTFKVKATQVIDKKTTKALVSPEYTVIGDVTIFEYEEVLYCGEKDVALVVGVNGYSDYSKNGKYGNDYVIDELRKDENATVISTTAFRGLRESVKSGIAVDAGAMLVTIPEIAAGQKGVNFAYYGVDFVDANKDKNIEKVAFGFYGDQKVASDFTVEVDLDIDAYELRERFGKKVEEEDIITYYIVENGKEVGSFTVDYMKDDIDENIVLEINRKAGSTLGQYELVLEVPAAPAEGEENPNTGAESVIGVVAAMAVVSVAAAAAVSLKK